MTTAFTPNFSAVAAYSEAAAMVEAVRAQDWSKARSLLNDTSASSATELIRAGAGVPRSEEFFRAVLDRDPTDPAAATLLARRHIDIGWGIRGTDLARNVSYGNFAAFHNHLRQAEQLLISACADDPTFAPAWCERLVTARGLELGQAESRRRYDHLDRRAPHHPRAQTELLQQLCPKWGGDLGRMHAFATACAAAAPAGAPNAALLVDAHLEHWLDSKKTDLRYFTDRAVQEEIRTAGERSVLHPDFQRTVGWVHAMSLLALGYSLIGDWTQAKHCFTALGSHGDRRGWQYLPGGAGNSFATNRAKAMSRG